MKVSMEIRERRSFGGLPLDAIGECGGRYAWAYLDNGVTEGRGYRASFVHRSTDGTDPVADCWFASYPDAVRACEMWTSSGAHSIIRSLLDREDTSQPVQYGQPGSVSSGTLRSTNLIQAFSDTLEDLYDISAPPSDIAMLIGRASEWLNAVADTGVEPDPDDLIESLIDALNQRAPKGFYFGAHPGDGADFGFWPIEEQDD